MVQKHTPACTFVGDTCTPHTESLTTTFSSSSTLQLKTSLIIQTINSCKLISPIEISRITGFNNENFMFIELHMRKS